MAVTCIVVPNGKLLLVQAGANTYHFNGSLDDEVWNWLSDTEDNETLTTAAGGAETVQGTEDNGTITFNYNGVTYVYNGFTITPDVIGEWTPSIADPTTLYINTDIRTDDQDPIVTDSDGHLANVVIDGDAKILVQSSSNTFDLKDNNRDEPLMDGCLYFADSLSETSFTWGDYTINMTQSGRLTFTPNLAEINS